jgi:RNA polymerase sigma-70 factor, ECF subfamily
VRVLVRRARELVSDPDDFDEFYLDCRDRLVAQVAALTDDLVEGQDHVQEAFVQGWARWDRICRHDIPKVGFDVARTTGR